MKNSILILFSLLILIIHCKEKVETKAAVIPKKIEKKVFKIEEEKFYGVYQLNDSDFAICIPVQMGNGKNADSLSVIYEKLLENSEMPWIYGKEMGDYSYYDTLHVNRLIYNENFDKVFRKSFKNSYFIFGTESKMKCGIKKVVFESNECGSDFIALILDLKPGLLKNPVIASEKDFDLKFITDPAADQKIKEIAGKEATENMYGQGNYQPKTFGKIEDYYFSYDDDFKWFNKKYEGGKQFPERLIAKIDRNNFKIIWANELDLLGLPCL